MVGPLDPRLCLALLEAHSPSMETAGDSGNLKWWLLGYKLPQSALTAKTKGCHLAGGRALGEGAGKMKRLQDFQNKQLGHGLEGILFSGFPTV